MEKGEATELLSQGTAWLAEQQDILYAQDRWSLLLIFQAMDAAGKDGTIKHVMSGINPQGCQVFSFKQPSSEDLDHDFLWRYFKCLPERGRIGIFNRSYYEEVLVVRVHPEILANEKLPQGNVGKKVWDERLADIANIESYLTRQGTMILKFFLHVSRDEQKKRFMERLDTPEKSWKFSLADIQERDYWDDYMHAFEEAIQATAGELAPWYVVPADHKWFTRNSSSLALLEKRWTTSDLVTRRSTLRRKRNWLGRVRRLPVRHRQAISEAVDEVLARASDNSAAGHRYSR